MLLFVVFLFTPCLANRLGFTWLVFVMECFRWDKNQTPRFDLELDSRKSRFLVSSFDCCCYIRFVFCMQQLVYRYRWNICFFLSCFYYVSFFMFYLWKNYKRSAGVVRLVPRGIHCGEFNIYCIYNDLGSFSHRLGFDGGCFTCRVITEWLVYALDFPWKKDSEK